MNLKKIFAGICGLAVLASGSMAVSASAEMQYPEGVYGYLGDMNQDWQVNVQDIISLQRYLLNVDTITQNQTYFADTTQDGQVNIYDFILCRNSY